MITPSPMIPGWKQPAEVPAFIMEWLTHWTRHEGGHNSGVSLAESGPTKHGVYSVAQRKWLSQMPDKSAAPAKYIQRIITAIEQNDPAFDDGAARSYVYWAYVGQNPGFASSLSALHNTGHSGVGFLLMSTILGGTGMGVASGVDDWIHAVALANNVKYTSKFAVIKAIADLALIGTPVTENFERWLDQVQPGTNSTGRQLVEAGMRKRMQAKLDKTGKDLRSGGQNRISKDLTSFVAMRRQSVPVWGDRQSRIAARESSLRALTLSSASPMGYADVSQLARRMTGMPGSYPLYARGYARVNLADAPSSRARGFIPD